MKKKYLLVLFALFLFGIIKPEYTHAQVKDINSLVARIDSLREENSIFRFGLSIGPRIVLEERNILRRRNASISPTDSTLQFDQVDKFEIAIAGVVAAYPFVQSDKNFLWCIPLKGLGFLAKLNLADFGPDSFVVNRVIEGGFGLSYSFGREFAIGLTIERVNGNRVRSHFSENNKVISQGEVILDLDPTNDQIFVDDNFSALSLSWIYSF